MSPRWTPRLVAALAWVLLGGAATARAQQDGRTPRAPTLPGPQDTSLAPGRLSAALRRYHDTEPSVDRVVRAALAAATDDPARAHELAARARTSGWVPILRVGARRGRGRDASELFTDDSGRTNLSTADDLVVSGSLIFRLDRLVFSRQEVPLLREERSLSEARRGLIRTVVHIYFERRRLQLERDLLGLGGVQRALRIEEAGALLDAFTGGAFRRMMGPRGRRSPR